MRKHIVAIIIAILFLSSPADALYRVTDFTGGCADCLDYIDGARLNLKTKPQYAIVGTTPQHSTYPSKDFAYQWDSDAACSESLPDTIIPDTNASGGCWILLTPGQAADIVDDSVKDVSIDWGTGAEQVSAVDVPIADGGALITGTEVETALQENRGLVNANTTAVATSAGLAASLSDETGSGPAVFGTSPTITTPTISGNLTVNSGGDVVITKGALSVSGDPSVGGDVQTIFGLLEGFGIHDDAGNVCADCNVLYIEQKLSRNSGVSNNAQSAYFQLQFENAALGSETYTGDIFNIVNSIRLGNAGDYTVNSISNVVMTMNNPASGTGDVTTADYYGIKMPDGSNAGSGLFNVTDTAYGIYLGNKTGISGTGTIVNNVGLWIAEQDVGDTNNYGIVIDSDTVGTTYGAGQDATVKFDGNDMQYNNMPLNDLGTMSVCSAWASIENPYMCLGYLDGSMTTETDVIAGYQFTHNGTITQSDRVAKKQVWTIDPSDGDEYLSRADDANFSFSGTGGAGADTPFSGAAWVEVVTSQPTAIVIGKTTSGANQEWNFKIASLKPNIFLRDDSAGANCQTLADSALSAGWHLIGFTNDGSETSAGLKLYSDGALIASTGTADCAGGGYVSMEDLAIPVTIWGESDAGNIFPDDRGHVALFPVELTADQELKMYNNSKMFYGL